MKNVNEKYHMAIIQKLLAIAQKAAKLLFVGTDEQGEKILSELNEIEKVFDPSSDAWGFKMDDPSYYKRRGEQQ